MTAFMYRYAVYEGYDLSIAYPDRYDSFPDTDEVSDWAVSSMDWAVGNAIINGTDGYLDPQGKAERCQVAQIIFNLYAFTM